MEKNSIQVTVLREHTQGAFSTSASDSDNRTLGPQSEYDAEMDKTLKGLGGGTSILHVRRRSIRPADSLWQDVFFKNSHCNICSPMYCSRTLPFPISS